MNYHTDIFYFTQVSENKVNHWQLHLCQYLKLFQLNTDDILPFGAAVDDDKMRLVFDIATRENLGYFPTFAMLTCVLSEGI